MLQKGPNFKNFSGKISLLNLRIPAQLGVYAALYVCMHVYKDYGFDKINRLTNEICRKCGM